MQSGPREMAARPVRELPQPRVLEVQALPLPLTAKPRAPMPLK